MKTVWSYTVSDVYGTVVWIESTDKETADAYAAVNGWVCRGKALRPVNPNLVDVELP